MDISIIVPVYNPGRKIHKCIKSILNQNYNKFELILVNDGSTDNSLDICKMYSQIDNRVKVVNQKNSGSISARYAGIKLAKGRYITFVDSDDYVHKDLVGTLYYEIKSNNCDIVVCKSYKVIGDRGIIKKDQCKNKLFEENNIYTGQDINEKLTSQFLVKKSYL